MKTYATHRFKEPINMAYSKYNAFDLFTEKNVPCGSIEIYSRMNLKTHEFDTLLIEFIYVVDNNELTKEVTIQRDYVLNSDIVKICPVFIPNLHIVGFLKIK